ncbi:MAG: SEC-C domain-containing protein [Akkermansiaceae bacterium]|nr:SEC-C domain-containing protein [Akkermansiaceae bacterium]
MSKTKKPDRNDPCPCGSGRKYKKCCLESDSRKQAEVDRNGGSPAAFDTVTTDLDELSNSVVGLIEAGDLAKAEEVCHRLRQSYPDQVDGIMRLAEVKEARGNRTGAATLYREAAAFMRTNGGFGDESIGGMIEAAERLEG